MRVLVTGGAGFIGSHVVDKLISDGDDVAIVDNLSTGLQGNLNPKARFYRLDVSSDLLDEVFATERPEGVIHLAAQVSVVTSMHDPVFDAQTNIMGTLKVLECCRKYAVRRIIFASSSAVYGKPQSQVIMETHPVEPLSAYGVSKAAGETYIRLFSTMSELSYGILRYANVFGPRQRLAGEGAVVPCFIGAMLRRTPCDIYGDGEQTRDFIYVHDVAEANVAALRENASLTSNISTGSAISILELHRMLQGITRTSEPPRMLPERLGDIRHSCLANQFAKRSFGWRPTYGLDEGLMSTAAYFSGTMRKPGI